MVCNLCTPEVIHISCNMNTPDIASGSQVCVCVRVRACMRVCTWKHDPSIYSVYNLDGCSKLALLLWYPLQGA